jgi:hypothetical protein
VENAGTEPIVEGGKRMMVGASRPNPRQIARQAGIAHWIVTLDEAESVSKLPQDRLWVVVIGTDPYAIDLLARGPAKLDPIEQPRP